MRLDAKTVTGLRLPDGKADVIHFDSALPGFGFRLRASGNEVRKSWVVQYRRAGGTRRMLLGSAEVLSAEQARAAAKKTLAAIALGGDPQAEKAARRSADKFTLAAMIEDYLASKESQRPGTDLHRGAALSARAVFQALAWHAGRHHWPPGCCGTTIGDKPGEWSRCRRQRPQRAQCTVRVGLSQWAGADQPGGRYRPPENATGT